MECLSSQDLGTADCRQAPPRPCRHSRKSELHHSLPPGGRWVLRSKSRKEPAMVCLTNSKNGNKVTHTHALSVTTLSCHRLTAARSCSRSDTTPWCHSFRSRRFATPGGRLFRILPQDKETLPVFIARIFECRSRHRYWFRRKDPCFPAPPAGHRSNGGRSCLGCRPH